MNRTTAFATILVLTASFAVPANPQAPRDISAWKNSTPEQPAVILVQGATIWTSGPEGVLEDADLLIKKGKIAKIGKGLNAPNNAVVIDGSGKHVTAGLIDAHNHSAIVGGVNEGSNITTAEVRIGDVVNSESINVYRQLAGGLTVANLLHGSANSIGGQNAVIKLRWGALPEEMKIAGAPEGIKFALGENPKQSNFTNDNPRYPATRAGVERSIRERFEAARDYREAWVAHEQDPSGVPPQRDLQLDALVEIMNGERLVHSHSYRADEILMLLRIAEDFGFTVASFQHVLEGYKVADELAAAGSGASTFSDWWAYKFEVIDAIPYNGAIMQDRGVVVSFNSDSSDLARRLNTEAAKAVRYGGVPEAEALKFVTLNPAIQLGIDDRVGSLEKGKDADFVVWSGHPLSTYTICEQTWIDGRKYFDRQDDLSAREAIAAERQELLAKVRAEAEKEEEESEKEGDEGEEAEKEPEPAYILSDEDHSGTCRSRDGEEQGGTR
jgi:imidazolonepropionase-like amidohydrolase